MTSVHPIGRSDETVVQISEDGLRSSDQQVVKQQSAESNRDQADHDEMADQEQTGAPDSKGDELSMASSGDRSFDSNSTQMERAVSSNPTANLTANPSVNQTFNQTDAAVTSESPDDVMDNVADNVANRAPTSDATDSSRTKSAGRSTSSKSSKSNKSNQSSKSNKSKEQTTRRISNSSHSSHGSSVSSSSSSIQVEPERQPAEIEIKENGLHLLDKTQTIFKPLINGLTNSLQQTTVGLFRAKPQEPEQFTFTWSNLSYFVHTSNRFGLRRKKKFIFNKINGELKSNQLFGLLGPSGAGKSSLLDCLSLKRLKNVSGKIKINGKLNKYKMAYIPQNDEYFEDLTCLEILTYASRLKNSSASFEDTLLTLNKEVKNEQSKLSNRLQTFHHRVARNVLNLLGLIEQQHTYAGRLSGGQKKRLSVAQELVIKPHIVFMDEPTSGLDSNSAYLCISLLSQLVKQSTPIAIVCTIHQPNPKMLTLFDQIYVLSGYGLPIYNAPPSDMVARLEQENIDLPIHYNPVDFLLEIASGEYESSYIERMADQVKRHEKTSPLKAGDESKDAIKAFAVNISESFNSQFGALLGRCFLLTLRNPMLTTNRILSHLIMALFIGWVFGSDVGKAADCPPKMSLLLDAEELTKMTNQTIENSKSVMDNMASVFFGILVMLLGSLLPTLITFPLEVKILQKEYFNGWYGIKPFFLARTLADMPLQLLVPFSYVALTYFLNGQPLEEFRFVNFSLIFVLTAVIAQAHGIIISAIFSQNLMAAVYLGPISALPLLLFSGFLVRIERMPWIIRPLTYVSYMRFGFEGIVISIYGFNRCGDEAVEQIRRVRKQLDAYFTNLMGFVEAGINCEEDWDKANIVMLNSSETNQMANLTGRHADLRLDLSSLKASVVGEQQSERLMLAENKTENNGINQLFNNLLDVLFNSQLDKHGKIVPRVMQLFDLKDAFLYRSVLALTIFTIVTRIMCFYIIRYKATMRN